jgi:DNA-binding NarL/FixJ family response regulator
LTVIPRVKPDVLLLDVYLPKRSGLEVLATLRESDSLPPTLVLTTFDDDRLVIGALRAGAKGFLLKDVSLEQLTGAIRTLARGDTFVQTVTPSSSKALAGLSFDFPSSTLPSALTAREVEIVRLMARGHSNREIADALAIAEGTVKNYVSGILSKMGVRDRTRAVLKALETGIL